MFLLVLCWLCSRACCTLLRCRWRNAVGTPTHTKTTKTLTRSLYSSVKFCHLCNMQWDTSDSLVEYDDALARMTSHVDAMKDGQADELVWLVEHPPLYTAGSSAKAGDLLTPDRFPVYDTGRGGQYTYHGPGQRVGYVMLNLKQRAGEGVVPDVRVFVKQLEQWIINTLAHYDLEAYTREGRIGVWVDTPAGESKIAALGIRLTGGITYHGIAINASPDLTHYEGIVPCGISQFGVTSLEALGKDANLVVLDERLKQEFSVIL